MTAPPRRTEALGRSPRASAAAATMDPVRRTDRRKLRCTNKRRRLPGSIALIVGACFLVAAPPSSRPSSAMAFHPKSSVPLRSNDFGGNLRGYYERSVHPRSSLVKSRRRLAMAAGKGKGKEEGDEGGKGGGGVFGGFFGGKKKASDASDDDKDKKGEDGSGPIKSLSRRFFRRSSSDDGDDDDARRAKKLRRKEGGDGKKGGGGIVVDMSTFVGPKFPSVKNPSQDAKDDGGKGGSLADLKAKRAEELKKKKEEQDRAKKEAERKAREAAEEKKRKKEQEKADKDWRSAILKAAQTKAKGGGDADSKDAKAPSEGGPGVIKSAAGFVSGVWDNVFGVKDKNPEEWVVVCQKTRLAPGEIVPVNAAGLSLLVVVSRYSGKIHAMSNSCPHLGTPLETGVIERRLKPGMKKPEERQGEEKRPASQQQLGGQGATASAADNECFEDCIVCPLHNTAFELETGEVRGEWCPYPPVIGAVMGTVKPKTNLPKFDIRTRGKNVEVRLNTSLE